jgi:hypothetical protein
MTTTKKLWIGIGVLVLLTPLGLIIPALFGAGGAWGEWGLREMEKLSGFVPEGMKRLAERWKSPMPGYSVPGQGKGLGGGSMGYIITAVIGVALTAGAGYLLAKYFSRKDRKG